MSTVFDASPLAEVSEERARQDAKWGEQNRPDGTSRIRRKQAEFYRDLCGGKHHAGDGTWLDILFEEVYEAAAEEDPAKLRAELIQVAAVAVAWAEAIDRRGVEPVSAIRVWPAQGTSTYRYESSVFKVHPDGDLTILRDEELIAVWARGQWQRVDAENG